MTLEDIQARRKPGREVVGIAALLLPFNEDGSIAEEAYTRLFEETIAAGLTPAVNMDTGYVNLLTDEERLFVLRLASEVAAGRPFVAGAFLSGEGDLSGLYRRAVEQILEHAGTPILFQTERLHGAPASEVARVYGEAVKGCDTAYAFELGRMFAPNGEIWPEDTVRALMEVPELKGMKHSSLDRIAELGRLSLRDSVRPEFNIFTGNDLGIDMIEYGSDYLLGLASFCPGKFAERDRLWALGDPGYLAVSDALQHLGNVAFRPPVPAYKHSAATFLYLLGKIPTDLTHPRAATRPAWEGEMLEDCVRRLDCDLALD